MKIIVHKADTIDLSEACSEDGFQIDDALKYGGSLVDPRKVDNYSYYVAEVEDCNEEIGTVIYVPGVTIQELKHTTSKKKRKRK